MTFRHCIGISLLTSARAAPATAQLSQAMTEALLRGASPQPRPAEKMTVALPNRPAQAGYGGGAATVIQLDNH